MRRRGLDAGVPVASPPRADVLNAMFAAEVIEYRGTVAQEKSRQAIAAGELPSRTSRTGSK